MLACGKSADIIKITATIKIVLLTTTMFGKIRAMAGAPQLPGQPGLEPRHVFRITKWVIFPNRTKMQ